MRLLLDPYVFNVLMRDLAGREQRPAAFLVYLMLWWKQAHDDDMQLSLQQLAGATGLSKSAVQASIRLLVRRRLVRADRDLPTSVPRYTLLRPWVR